MASTFVTLPSPLLSFNRINIPSRSTQTLLGSRKLALRVNAIVKKWEPTKVVPQADRVLVRLEQLPEPVSFCGYSRVARDDLVTVFSRPSPKDKSAGGVLLPKAAVKFERYLMGEILTVGTGVGQVDAGKKVLFSDVNAYEVDLGTDDKHCFVKETDLLAVVE